MYFPQFLILLHLALKCNVIICIMCFGRWYQVPLFFSHVGSFDLQVGKLVFSRSYKHCVWIHNMKAKFCRSLQVLKRSLHTMVGKRDVHACATFCYQVCKLLVMLHGFIHQITWGILSPLHISWVLLPCRFSCLCCIFQKICKTVTIGMVLTVTTMLIFKYKLFSTFSLLPPLTATTLCISGFRLWRGQWSLCYTWK